LCIKEKRRRLLLLAKDALYLQAAVAFLDKGESATVLIFTMFDKKNFDITASICAELPTVGRSFYGRAGEIGFIT
jgi:hypothetical protein